MTLNFCFNIISQQENISLELIQKALIINDYSIQVRYPGFPYEPTDSEAAEAIQIAETFRAFILSKI
jgi:hypothetical protein